MIWRLEYENAHGDVARLDIQRGAATPVEIIEGTENPFLLSYELEDKSKKGFIMSSFADISIYETDTFNIDDLKTLDETALSVKWYINSVLEWTGFVVPDFFSRTIGEPAIVNLAASDRLSSLEDATLDGLSEYVKLKDLTIACLAKTGLTLPLISTVDFKADNVTNIMDVFALSERLEDDKGKKISCYDVLRSILVLTNSTIRQRKGQWRIYNKIQHEAVAPTLNFNEVYQGAKRTIQPVLASVGVFQEFGGGKSFPINNSFKNNDSDWTKGGSPLFVTEFDNRDITFADMYAPALFGDVIGQNQLINRNGFNSEATGLSGTPFLKSTKINVPFRELTGRNGDVINPVIEINTKSIHNSVSHFVITYEYNGAIRSYLTNDSEWSNEFSVVDIEYIAPDRRGGGYPVDKVTTFEPRVAARTKEDASKFSISIYILGVSRPDATAHKIVAIRSIKVTFPEATDNGKGILYRTDQLGNFSKKSDSDTTIFGDFISSGLNGYFYPYRDNDKSALKTVDGSTYSSTIEWTTATDPDAGELPILQHVTRQISRMFGVAHNILSAVIDAKTFDPLAIVTNCAGEKYVIVYSVFDFLRSTAEVELQQIAYGSLQRRDFIFSYFGGGDGDGISSIGSVSGGGSSGGSGGGGGTPQTLDLIADELSISGGNSVDLGVYARKTWVETEATAYDSARLGGYAASSYPRRDVDETISGGWTFRDKVNFDKVLEGISFTNSGSPRWDIKYTNDSFIAGTWGLGFKDSLYNKERFFITTENTEYSRAVLQASLGLGIIPTERLHVAGNGLFTGAVTAGAQLSVAQSATFGGNTGTSNFVSQMLGWRVTPQGQADFRHIFTDELQAKAFTADISQALVGSDVLTKSVAKLAQNWATTANGATSTIYVEELEGFPDFQVFAVGDRLLLRLFDRAGGGLLIKNIWATVTSYVGTTKNVQRYTITVNSGGATGNTVYAGSMVLDYGTPGSGVIERTVLDQQGSPYSRVSTWTGSPDNPANYTLHYQSGNLNGIANANGWGVYSENSFLTGKLLVGDLTKAGQYMEYANGQLNIKGQITVTGGNAATKAEITAAESAAKGYADGAATAAETAAKTFATAEAAAVQVGGRNLIFKSGFSSGTSGDAVTGWGMYRATLLQVEADKPFSAPGVNAISWVIGTGVSNGGYFQRFRSPTGSSIADYFKAGEQYTVSAWIKASSAANIGISALGLATESIAATTEWKKYSLTFTGDGVTNPIAFYGYVQGVRYYLCMPKLELGNRATDWSPAPEDVPSALEYLAEALVGDTNIAGGLVTTNLLMVKDTNGTVRGGMSGLKSDNIGFWTGGSYQSAITNNANVIFRKDGSFSLADGKIIGTSDGSLSVDGGVVTGIIESSNYNGTLGSRFDLHNGHLLIGDAIRMSGDLSEIQVKNRDTGLDSFKIGDFQLTPTNFTGAGIDVPISSSPVTASAAAGSYQLNRTVYVSSSGTLTTSASNISTSLVVGGTYNLRAYLAVTLSLYQQVETVPFILNEGFVRKSGSGIKMQLKNGNTVVWEQNISGIPASGVIPLLISTSFQAVSQSLQLIITIDGEFEYRQPDGTDTRIYNTWASIERLNSSSRLVLRALISRMEFSTKGMQAIFSSTNYFRCDELEIQGRGYQTFISPDGKYRLRVSNIGIEKGVMTGGVVSWTLL